MVRLRLAEILQELGWTQSRLAQEAGISRQAISNLIHSPQAIRLETLEAISRATGKTISEIITTDDTME